MMMIFKLTMASLLISCHHLSYHFFEKKKSFYCMRMAMGKLIYKADQIRGKKDNPNLEAKLRNSNLQTCVNTKINSN